MPLTQLRTLVFPAPFGPTRAKISPRRTAKLTPSSTCSPPKASCSASTLSSSCVLVSSMPAALAAVLLDVPIALGASHGADTEKDPPVVRVPQQTRGGPLVHDPSVLHDVSIVGDAEGRG